MNIVNKLLVATSNPGKLAEIKLFLSDLPIRLLSLSDLDISEQPKETGRTFKENAILKARYYVQKSGLPTLADDGGLEIDALAGEPGVKSHRWIHQDRDAQDEELIAYTIKKMKGLPLAQRTAQLRVVLALVLSGNRVYTAQAKIRGVIPLQPATTRTSGFPYRALLYLPDLGKYYNQDELTPQENERYNHRKRALEKLKPVMRKYLC